MKSKFFIIVFYRNGKASIHEFEELSSARFYLDGYVRNFKKEHGVDFLKAHLYRYDSNTGTLLYADEGVW